MRCCLLGVIIGILISAACVYYFHRWKNPEHSSDDMKKIEQTWESAKSTGDKMIESVKPYAGQPQSSPENTKDNTLEN